MELSWIFAAILVFGVAVAAFFFLGRFGKKRREMSRAGLHRRASEEAESLRAFVDEREAKRPERDSVVKDHDLPSHRVTLHDEGTMEVYAREHLPEVAELRRQARDHGVKNETHRFALRRSRERLRPPERLDRALRDGPETPFEGLMETPDNDFTFRTKGSRP
jgi:hypothetical protein